MKTATLASLLLLASTSALAAASPAGSRLLALDEAVATLEAHYQGKVVAIALDDAGDKPAHYHVDMRFPESGLARVDVDAGTLEIAARDVAAPPLGLLHAVARVASAVDAPLLAAHLVQRSSCAGTTTSTSACPTGGSRGSRSTTRRADRRRPPSWR